MDEARTIKNLNLAIPISTSEVKRKESKSMLIIGIA